MRFRTFVLAIFLVASSFVVPHMARAASGIPFFGPIIPKASTNLKEVKDSHGNVVRQAVSVAQDSCPASWGMVIVVINNILKLLLSIVIVFIAPLSIAYAGFVLVVGQGNSGEITRARGILTHTIAGIVVSMSAWMIIAALLAVLMPGNSSVENWTNLISSGDADPCLNVADSFSFGAAVTPPPAVGGVTAVPPTPAVAQELEIRRRLVGAGVRRINKDSCPAGTRYQDVQGGCTTLYGMQEATISQIINVKNGCGTFDVTGGTELGHSGEGNAGSHSGGSKVDISGNVISCILRIGGGSSVNPPSFGISQVTDRCGNVYTWEGNHTDIFVTASCPLQ